MSLKLKFILYIALIAVVTVFCFLYDPEEEKEEYDDYYGYDYPEETVYDDSYDYAVEEPYAPGLYDSYGNEIHDFSDVEPQYPGGEEAMAEFIRENIEYPEWEREMGIEGTAYVQFVVNSYGEIENPEIIKTVDGSLYMDDEVIRVIEAMPDWIPGQKDGVDVSVRFTLPVNFQIAE